MQSHRAPPFQGLLWQGLMKLRSSDRRLLVAQAEVGAPVRLVDAPARATLGWNEGTSKQEGGGRNHRRRSSRPTRSVQLDFGDVTEKSPEILHHCWVAELPRGQRHQRFPSSLGEYECEILWACNRRGLTAVELRFTPHGVRHTGADAYRKKKRTSTGSMHGVCGNRQNVLGDTLESCMHFKSAGEVDERHCERSQEAPHFTAKDHRYFLVPHHQI